jgi:hypothetical protein
VRKVVSSLPPLRLRERRLQGHSQFLNRGPDPVGEQAWLSTLLNPTVMRDAIAEGFLASDEFFARAVSL